ncbi:Eco57I restriction-modification methylase domain-containing protein [Gillisia sp. JM1]|uniref:Eco57I restriction-modification methylase domain-containing protein n=1 Tax=Gillisia sp. JM1 TaxID=1283286 RepID=UPI000402DE1E|nr:DNA methyltransferase [Gillisia sp. JM1]
MSKYQDLLDESFIEQLNYEYIGDDLPTPEIEGKHNILNYSKEYQGNGIEIIVVECEDRLVEFQKKLIKNQKSFFPNAHFLFVSNNGKVFDLYNNATSSKLKKITYDEIGKNTRLFKEKLQLFDVTKSSDGTELQINAEKAFDTSDKITKKFFDKFKKIHAKLQKAITGIEDEKDRSWYASVMMNRIMFIYFLQKHKVIQGNTDFLLQKFDEVKANGKDYYSDFLLPLFFYGFARKDDNPEKVKFTKKYGPIRYLNGGLFYPHHLEKKYSIFLKSTDVYEEKALNTQIGINPKLIKEILVFLNGYTWYLDNRPMKEDTDINPDVLGYIFEKYINQKELGAYYTKEDITEYISKNTIIPFIFDKMNANGFNAPDPNPLITNNEDIIGAVGNYIDEIDNYDELKFLYREVLLELSVLDPSVGSGAFLFAALNILLPINQKVVFRLKELAKTENDQWLTTTIEIINKHPEEYFLTKQIILNNLYGVDIVDEATEICKLRLFLQLASHLPDITSIEPLPDIDFNIYAGNSLVGGLSWEDLEANYTMDLFTSSNRENIKKDIKILSKLKTEYRAIQQNDDSLDALNHLKNEIETQEYRVNSDINIGIDNPFHWFIDFNKILDNGGFDVIIGNPPYVRYSTVNKYYQVQGFESLSCGDLYGFFIERSFKITNPFSKIGLIVPISLVSSDGFGVLRNFIFNNSNANWFSSYSMRPGKLFDLVDKHLNIIISSKTAKSKDTYINSTKYNRWKSEDRDSLFENLSYIETDIDVHYNGSIPKIGSKTELNILKKLADFKSIENDYFKGGKFKVLHTRKLRYFVQFLDVPPKIIHENGELIPTSELKSLTFSNEIDRNVALSVYCSSLFFWYYITFSDCRNVNKREVASFPFELSKMDEIIKQKLSELSIKLMKNLQDNSTMNIMNYKKHGTLNVQSFKPRLSKPIIDKIDKLLADYYKFSRKELDFIINYDLPFRMGINDNED